MSRLFLFHAVLISLLLACSAYAQYGASLQGTITDKTGAVVPGATVTVTNQATGIVSTTKATEAGFYRIAALPPGMYTVKVEAASFGVKSAKDVTVSAEAVRGLDLTLEPAGATETVSVTAEAPAIQTENANVGAALNTAQIQRLPQYGRDPYELLRLAPGVFGDGARDGTGNAYWFPNSPGPDKGSRSIFSVENQVQVTANGQRLTGNNFMIDGTSVNSLTWGGAAIITPNQESVQEIAVTATSYSAEDGRNSGAQVKVVSKSGTNQIHGSAIFKYNEPGLNAFNKWAGPDPGAEPQRVNQKLRQFGGSVGGPIVKDKLFFFFSYEGNRSASSYTSTQYVLSPQLTQWITANRANTMIARQVGATGATARIVNVLPAQCSDLNGQWPSYSGCAAIGANGISGLDIGSPTLNYGDYVPTWAGDTTGGGLDGVPDLLKAQFDNPMTTHGNQFNVRLDYVHNNDLFAFSTYMSPRNDVVSTNLNPNSDLTFQPRNKYMAILWNRMFSQTLLNEFRFNATRFFTDQYSTNQDVLWGLPRLEIEMLPTRIVWGPPGSDNSPLMAAQNQFEFRDTISKVKGRHGLKTGFQLNLNQDNNNTMFGSSRPTFTFHGIWNFVNGAPIYEGINADPITGAPTDNHKYFRQTDYAFFVQDDLKLRKNLTLNLGLRYEYFAPLSEKYNRIANLILGPGSTGLQTATVKTGSPLYPADRNNFAPRLGFAWSPSIFQNKTVVRGGFGVAYNRITDTMTGIARVNPPFVYRYGICCAASAADRAVPGMDWLQPPFANGAINYNVIGTNYNSIHNYAANTALANNINPTTLLPIWAPGGIEIWGAPQKDRTPYIFTFSMEVERQLPSNFVATLGYQGSQSRKLLRVVNESKVYSAPSGSIGAVYFPSTDVNANYNAMLLSVNRPFSHGVQLMSKYRWSKSIDAGSGEGAGQARDPFWPADQRYDHGPSDFDSTQNLMITVMWDLPILRGRQDFLGKALGGWHIDTTYQFHTGFPWSPKAYGPNCLQVPANNGNICPNLPTSYSGKAGSNYSNSTFMTPGGNFPLLYTNGGFNSNGWQNYFTLGQGFPGVHRNSFRGPRYRGFDTSLAKTTRFSALGNEGMALDLRANFYNLFNQLNLKPFEWGDNSTFVTDPHFGQASSALAGRVIELQARISF